MMIESSMKINIILINHENLTQIEVTDSKISKVDNKILILHAYTQKDYTFFTVQISDKNNNNYRL